MLALARRQLTVLRAELNPPGAPPARWRDLSFFITTAIALIATRYYGRMNFYDTHSDQVPWVPKLTHALGLADRGLETPLYWSLVAVLARFLLPLAVALGVARVRRDQIGLRCVQDRGLAQQAMATMAIGIVASLGVAHFGLLDHLPLVDQARLGGLSFWAYEGMMLVQLAATGYLFFGFLLLGTERVIGPEAVILAALAFALNYGYRSGLEVGLIFVAGLALGHLTLRGRSVGPTLVVMSVVGLARDVIGLSQHTDALWGTLF